MNFKQVLLSNFEYGYVLYFLYMSRHNPTMPFIFRSSYGTNF